MDRAVTTPTAQSNPKLYKSPSTQLTVVPRPSTTKRSTMAFAGTEKAVLGSIAFSVFWIMAVFPAIPFLPIGRTAGSLLSSLLMILFQVINPNQAYAAIDLPILALLFATMLLSAYLEKAHLFLHLRRLLSYKSSGGRDLLIRVSFISALSSALFTNDTACILLTEFLLDFAGRQHLPPLPFLLALSSNANIGSSATPIGNPQNLVIAIQAKIPFGKFLAGILPAMLVGVAVNTAIILCVFWRSLSVPKKKKSADDVESAVPEHRFSPARMSSSVSESEVVEEGLGFSPARMSTENGDAEKQAAKGSDEEEGEKEMRGRRREKLLKWSVYLVTAGMLAALLAGMDMPWTAITAAIVLVVVDFRDAGPCLEKVSYSLLIFFIGMFITVDGFNKTGIPSVFWNLMEPLARVNKARGLALLSVVILLLSNLASNVPTVLLLGSQVAKSAAKISPSEVDKAWLILAWVSTVAGNFSLLGSAANLIVCEQARKSERHRYNLSFWKHLQFGVPSTLIVAAIGLPLIRG